MCATLDVVAKHLTGFNFFFYFMEYIIYLWNNLHLFKAEMKSKAWEMKLYEADDLITVAMTMTMV